MVIDIGCPVTSFHFIGFHHIFFHIQREKKKSVSKTKATNPSLCQDGTDNSFRTRHIYLQSTPISYIIRRDFRSYGENTL